MSKTEAELREYVKENENELERKVSDWFWKMVRPELLQNYIIEHMEKCIEDIGDEFPNTEITKQLNSSKQEEIYEPVVKAIFNFHQKYYNLIQNKDKSEERSVRLSAELHPNREVTGLGFGLITSSPAQAALFSAMDNHERNKQVKQQYNDYRKTVKCMLQQELPDLYSDVMELYKITCKEEVKEAIKISYEKIQSLFKRKRR